MVPTEVWELADLEENWDSYGGSRISRPVLYLVDNFVKQLPNWVEPYHAVPMSHGGVQLEWYKGEASLEIEFGDQILYLLCMGNINDPKSIIIEDTIDFRGNFTPINELVHRYAVFGGLC